MAEDAIRADVMKRFNSIPGVGLTKAEILFDSGFTTISSLKKASADELSAVKGISPALARFIVREVKGMSDEAPVEEVSTAVPSGEDPESATISVTETVPGEAAEAGEEEGEDAEAAEEAPAGEEGPGFIGGLISSIKSFFASEPEMPEEGDSGLSQEEIEAAAAASEVEEGAEEEGEEEAGTEAQTEPPEPTEASISVDHAAEDKEEGPKEEPREEVPEEDTTEPQGPEGPTDEGPTVAQSAMNFATDIKEKGLARIKAIRERLRSRGKPEDNEAGDSGLSKEEIEAAAASSKVEGDVKEEKEEEKEPDPPPKATDKKESDKMVDDIIKDLDLDSE